MKLRENAKYDLMTVTSMGLRITPFNRMPVATSRLYEMQATSAESNVLNISASLGKRTKVLTRFVENSPISAFIKGELRRRNIEYDGVSIPQGDPWGYRHQINIADAGYGFRAPHVLNDRAGEVGKTIEASDFDLEQIFEKDGCRILHLSGLVAALSPESTDACLQIARFAKKHGTAISFDLNHRASFWEGREEELLASFQEIASLADILIGNEEDYQLALDVEGPPPGDEASDHTDEAIQLDAFKEMIQRASETFPNVEVFATTLRHVLNANEHAWGALLRAEGQWFEEAPKNIQIMDRIGGGDGFVGGLLYSILSEWEPSKWVQFAWATGAMASSVTDDFASPINEGQVWSIYEGNARVQR